MREKFICHKNGNSQSIRNIELTKSRLSTLLNKIFLQTVRFYGNGQTMAINYKQIKRLHGPVSSMTQQFALPMIVTIERLMRELLKNDIIKVNNKIIRKLQEALNITDTFLQHKKRINTIMMNQLGYVFSEIRELLLIERKPEYHEKRNHETKTGDNREHLVKEQELIKNTNSQNNEMKLREKKNTKITQPLLPYFRKEVMKMRKDPQFNGKDQKVEAVAAVLNDSAHCSIF